MDSIARSAIENRCARVMNQFFWSIDQNDYESAIALFVPDCTFSRADAVYQGHDGLRTVLANRDQNRLTRHVNTNIVIDVADADHASGKSYGLVFGHRGPLSPTGEASLSSPDSLVLSSADFVVEGGIWRVLKWHVALCFRKPPVEA